MVLLDEFRERQPVNCEFRFISWSQCNEFSAVLLQISKIIPDICNKHCMLYLQYLVHAPISLWRHKTESFYALLALCAGEFTGDVRGIHRSPVNCPHKGPVKRSCDVFFDLRLNKQLRKQSWGWWFETPSPPLWRHSNVTLSCLMKNRVLSDCIATESVCIDMSMFSLYWNCVVKCSF